MSSPTFAFERPAQSVLSAQGDAASRTLEITWVLLIGGTAIFVVVLAMGAVAVWGPQRWRALLSRRGMVLAGGIVFPVVALTALLVYTFTVAAGQVRAMAGPGAVRIDVTGELWWWRVRYLDAEGRVQFETANEIRLPVGQPADLALRAREVVHSFWVPNLAGKLDMLPGQVNRLRLQPQQAGVYRGQCAEFCGVQHARMAFHVVAVEPAEFERWRQERIRPAAAPAGAAAVRGLAVFQQARCAACHTIRGTPAAGTNGPDLTHVGSRLALGAGTLPNNAGSLIAWIADVQHAKPGSLMPAYRGLPPEDLRALASYLEGLR